MKHAADKTQQFRFALWWWVPILLVSFGLRFWQLAQIPVTLNRDEAALAYNAFLLDLTGKDEWQQAWPLALKSFGDFKLPGYVWAVIVSFKLFGFSDWAVKFPSALAGALLPVVMYFVSKRVLSWGNKSSKAVMAVTAVLPVLVFYSRIAFEANLALTLLLTSFLCLFDQKAKPSLVKVVIGLVIFLLAVLTYNTPLLLLPFILVYAVIFLRKPEISSTVRVTMLLGFMFIGLFSAKTLTQIASQKQTVTIFGDEAMILAANENYSRWSGLSQKIFGNKVVFWSKLIAERYVATFSPNFLVIRGGEHPWHQLPGAGHLTLGLYVLAMIGIFAGVVRLSWLMMHQEWLGPKDTVSLLLLLTIVAPFPAAITVDAPHATRSLLLFVLLGCWSVYGWRNMVLAVGKKKKKIGRFVQLGLAILLFVEVSSYAYRYFTNYGPQSAEILKAGYAQQVQRIAGSKPLDKVAVIDPDGYQYILTAWELRMPPETFFATINHHLPDKIGFEYGYKVGQFRFVVSPNDQLPEESTLVEWIPESKVWQTSVK